MGCDASPLEYKAYKEKQEFLNSMSHENNCLLMKVMLK